MKVRHIISSILIMVLIFGGGFYADARLFSNHSDDAYNEGDGTSGTSAAIPACYNTIGELIIKGGVYFFKARADIDLLSENTEVSDLYGTDFHTLFCAVTSALDNMNIARYYYRELEYKAGRTPYNPEVIAKLTAFNYAAFKENNDLLSDVFTEVENYLVKGDVRGVYRQTSIYFDSLTGILEDIKEELTAGKVPSNKNMWALNQVCAKAHMFGQYVARVFYAVE